MAAVNNHSESRRSDRRVSCETLCSSNSSCVLQKRKPLHPLASSIRSRPSNNPVTQRVLSAKLLRFKNLQNQLNDANYHITQLVNENKILKNLQRRQDQALSKYEGANAQLPQVLESHQEELRVLQIKNKNLRKNVKDLTDQLKNKDEEIIALKDQNKHLLSLCKNKNLEERKELQIKVEDLEERLRQNENTINVLNRKLMLETKNYKYKLSSEVTKHKQTQRELHRAVSQLEELSSVSEVKLNESQKRPSSKIKSKSVTYLSDQKPNSILKKSPTPTVDKMKEKILHKISESSLLNIDDNHSSSSSQLQFLNDTDEASISSTSKTSDQDQDPELDLSSSEYQLKEIVTNWNKKTSKIEEKIDEEMKKYNTEVMNDLRYTNNTIEKHTQNYQNSMKETEIIMQSLKENDAKQEKLSQLNNSGEEMTFFDYTILSTKSRNDGLMKHILNEKEKNYSFEEDLLSETTSKTLTISEPEVDHEDKRKLLAKLKAIDNGDNVVITDVKKPKCELMKELFGS